MNSIIQLTRAKKQSNGSYLGHCPAHDDKTPSFSIKFTKSKNPLVHCFAGCNFEEVRQALKERGCWNTSSNTSRGTHVF